MIAIVSIVVIISIICIVVIIAIILRVLIIAIILIVEPLEREGRVVTWGVDYTFPNYKSKRALHFKTNIEFHPSGKILLNNITPCLFLKL